MTRLVNGAKVSHRRPAPAVPKPVAPEPKAPSDAYLIARANQHKPWARRWLRQRGHFV